MNEEKDGWSDDPTINKNGWMSNGKKTEALPSAEAGIASFCKTGEEYGRLQAIMEAKGTAYNAVTVQWRSLERRANIDELIIDPIDIILDKACDSNKKPMVTVFMTTEDGDTVCIIVLEVPLKNDYGKLDNGTGDALLLD
jgi:hypothetical protein